MKFANIDEAITEAAKKQPAKEPKKMEKKPVPAKKAEKKPVPAKKVAPKAEPKAPKPPVPPAKKEKTPEPETSSDEPKTTEPAPKKKVLPKKKVSAPAKTAKPTAKSEPKAEPKKEEPKAAEPEKSAETKPVQSAPSGEKRKFAPRWLEKKRGIGDRLKSAWKSFTAKPGADLGKAGTSYKSVFHEIKKLMEELQLVEAMLREQSLNESYDANAVNDLYAHRNAIRGVLVEQMIREELYKHNTTLAELNHRQRAALSETVKTRSSKMWEQLAEISFGDWQGTIQRANQGEHPIDMVPTEQPVEDEENEAVVIQPTGDLAALLDKLKNTPTHKTKTSQHARVMEKPEMDTDEEDVDEGLSKDELLQYLKKHGNNPARLKLIDKLMQKNEIEMEEGKLSRLAAGLGLAGAAMMGGAGDAEAQSATPAQPQRTVQSFTMQRGPDGNQVAVDAQGKPVKMRHTPADSVSTQKSRDMQMAVDKAEFDLRSKGIDPMAVRGGQRVFKRDITQNPDGTFTAKIAPDRGESPMEEAYTLEEWMGMMEEAWAQSSASKPTDTRQWLAPKGTMVRGADGQARWKDYTDLERKDADAQKRSDMQQDYQKAVQASKDPNLSPGKRWQHQGDAHNMAKRAKEFGVNVTKTPLPARIPAAQRQPTPTAQATKPSLPLPGKTVAPTQPTAPVTKPSLPLPPKRTMEEWMGKLDEAGYDISELSPETLASYNAKATKDLETHDNIMKRDSSNYERKARNRHRGIQTARAGLRAQGLPTEVPSESVVAENTVSRLQQLAGIKPLNG